MKFMILFLKKKSRFSFSQPGVISKTTRMQTLLSEVPEDMPHMWDPAPFKNKGDYSSRTIEREGRLTFPLRYEEPYLMLCPMPNTSHIQKCRAKIFPSIRTQNLSICCRSESKMKQLKTTTGCCLSLVPNKNKRKTIFIKHNLLKTYVVWTKNIKGATFQKRMEGNPRWSLSCQKQENAMLVNHVETINHIYQKNHRRTWS